MQLIQDEDIEALAREMMRQTIIDSGWYPSLKDEERRKRIEQDVELHWHLMITEAKRRLERRQGPNA